MRNKLLLTVFAFCLFSIGSQAQTTFKVGFTNQHDIISLLPETQVIMKKIEAHSKEFEAEFLVLNEEYEQKLAAYYKEQKSMTISVKEDTEKELNKLSQTIQNFQENTQFTLDREQLDLLGPLYKKIKSAIQKLAKEEGFNLILDGNDGDYGNIIYADEQLDVTAKVLKILGVE